MAHADTNVVPSESSEEDNDDHFFEQELPHDNRKFMLKIWEGLKKIYKLVNGLIRRKNLHHHT